MKCSKKECTNEASNSVSIELRVHPSHEPAKSTPIIYVCDEHANVEWSEVVTDESFQKIGDSMQAIGRMRPVKKFCNLVIMPLNENNNSTLPQ